MTELRSIEAVGEANPWIPQNFERLIDAYGHYQEQRDESIQALVARNESSKSCQILEAIVEKIRKVFVYPHLWNLCASDDDDDMVGDDDDMVGFLTLEQVQSLLQSNLLREATIWKVICRSLPSTFNNWPRTSVESLAANEMFPALLCSALESNYCKTIFKQDDYAAYENFREKIQKSNWQQQLLSELEESDDCEILEHPYRNKNE